MKVTLKITAGVWLGVVAAFIAVSTPGCVQKSPEESSHERAAQTMSGLTPDRLMSRCGKPLKDKTEDAYRYIYYKRIISQVPTVFSFARSSASDTWMFLSMYDVTDLDDKLGLIGKDGKRLSTDDPYLQVSLFTCLEGK